LTKESKRHILNALKIGLIVNILLAGLKLTFGMIGNAQALFSDGLNSLSDVLISVMLLFFMKIATQKPDEDHPYGHEKYEGLAYFALGIIFFFIALYIGFQAFHAIIDIIRDGTSVVKPSFITVIISSIALVVKVILYTYLRKVSKKVDSPTIKADAKNHLIDAWATLASVIGLGLAQLDLIIFDAIASFIIGLFILRLGIEIIKDAISYLTDMSPSEEEMKQIEELILSIAGVIKVDDLKVRRHMNKRYVDVEIAVDGELSLKKAHNIAETVHHRVEIRFSDVIHCMVHVNPYHNKQK
jgi:cation diffusion facilitator family transporter